MPSSHDRVTFGTPKARSLPGLIACVALACAPAEGDGPDARLVRDTGEAFSAPVVDSIPASAEVGAPAPTRGAPLEPADTSATGLPRGDTAPEARSAQASPPMEPSPAAGPEPRQAAPVSGILTRHDARDPSWPDSVARLLSRRFDDPERKTIENYFLYLPPGFGVEEDREWPVLLYLHGRSLRGSDLNLVKRYGIPSLIERGYEFPFIIVSPQLPDGQHWVDVERMWELLDEEVLERYPIDDDRVYATGFSMGAGGTWRLAFRYADELAAAVPISATTPRPTDAWVEAIDDLPMLVYHGDRDELVPYRPAVDMVAYLREAGLPVELILLEGEGHGIVQDVYRDPELYIWLLSHER